MAEKIDQPPLKNVPDSGRHAPWPQTEHGHTAPHGRQKKNIRCRYFTTKNGCRAGDACPFIHDPSRLKGHGRSAQRTENSSPDVSKPTVGALAVVASGSSDTAQLAITASVAQRRYESVPVDSSKVVQKPVSRLQADDPREFQMQQLRRRFSPKETTEEHGTVLTFKLIPSDPDFPFEMEGLDCVLHVPQAYPTNGKPRLDVRNKEMDRGYQINVERGFDALVAKSSRLTLLGLMNSLDKQLESLLTEQKAETIKLVANAYHESRGDKAKSSNTLDALLTDIPIKAVEAQPAVQTYTDEQKKIAQINRENETRQLEARLGRLPRFFKSSDGITYTIPIEPRRRGDLPVPLQIVKTVRLFVPMLYPLQSCRIEVQGVAREAAKNTESNFERKAKESHEMTLIGHINYLSQHMHVLATESIEENVARPEQRALPDVASLQMKQPIESDGAIYTDNDFDDRSHIKVIPRPPEWAVDRREGEDDDENSDSPDAYDSEDDSMDDEGVQLPSSVAASHSVPDRGILISFPQLELYGIELLELVSLCITVKCERCKDPMDVNHLRDHTRSDALSVRTESCKKCANPLRAAYRSELMHVNSVRAGQLDLDGCTVIDMLPSHFLPTCSECSTSYPSPGIVSVRGESSMAICRECHRKMTFKLPEVKFLQVSQAAVRAARALPRKKGRENLGIVAGQELPRRGRCTHYSKSYRWFRFGCCSKVFPCDKCHDLESDHPNEHAPRMICGFCSREQHYRPEDCSICHLVLIGKKGSGFWEGGKGTRDKSKMSKKDPRKYKRRLGGAGPHLT